MKTSLSLSKYVLALLVLLTPLCITHAGTHRINQCARIMNIDQYPEYTFVAFYRNPSAAYVFSNGSCLRYGVNMSEDFAIYYSADPDFTIEDMEVSEGINERGQTYFYPTNLEFLNRGKLVGEFTGDDFEKPHKVEYHEYSITGNSIGELSLYKSREIFRDTTEAAPTPPILYPTATPISPVAVTPTRTQPIPSTKTPSVDNFAIDNRSVSSPVVKQNTRSTNDFLIENNSSENTRIQKIFTGTRSIGSRIKYFFSRLLRF